MSYGNCTLFRAEVYTDMKFTTDTKRYISHSISDGVKYINIVFIETLYSITVPSSFV